jgi:hypothetical protein
MSKVPYAGRESRATHQMIFIIYLLSFTAFCSMHSRLRLSDSTLQENIYCPALKSIVDFIAKIKYKMKLNNSSKRKADCATGQ